MKQAIILSIVAVVLIMFTSLPAQAHKRELLETYEWFTAAKGELELELWNDYAFPDNEWKNQVELEYGVTERWQTSVYAVFEKEPGGSLKYHEFKWENVYRFGDYKPKRWLVAVYFEPEWESGEGTPKFDNRLILTRYSGNRTLSANLRAVVGNGRKPSYRYSVGFARRSNMQGVGFALEAYGDISEVKHYLLPQLNIDLQDNMRVLVGPAIGLTSGSDSLVLRSRIEYEFE